MSPVALAVRSSRCRCQHRIGVLVELSRPGRPPLMIWCCDDNTEVDPARWQELFEELLGRVAGRFARADLRRRARAFVRGLLADLPRRNCWTIAEHVGDHSPDGMQHLLARAVWDEDKVRDDVRDYVVAHLGDPQATLVIDETGDLKKGTHTVGGAAPVHRHRGSGGERPGRGLPGVRRPRRACSGGPGVVPAQELDRRS
jgi:hypothetical protein